MKFLSQKTFVGLLAAAVISLGLAVSASATSTDKVTICHATSSNSNPYVSNQPDKSGDVNGHDGHNGPVWFSGIGVSWGDIIPPFDYQTTDVIGTHLECTGGGYSLVGNVCKKNNKPDQAPVVVNDYGPVTHHYPGKNWDANGQSIYANNCNVPVAVTPTPTPTVTPTVTPSVTPTGTVTPTPTSGVTPTVTVAPTNPPTNGGGPGDGLGCATHDCSGNQVGGNGGPAVLGASTQAVLGASTFAGTGTFENNLMSLMLLSGIVVLVAGSMSYAKEKKN